MLDKRRIRRSFDRAADSYDEFAVVQNETADRLLKRLEVVDGEPPRTILDIGCGTGHLARALGRRFPGARVIGVDLAPAMVSRAAARRRFWDRSRYVCADAERLPFSSTSMDLVVSSLALQWCDAPAMFAEVARVLRPGGRFHFATFGPDTLKELRAAWAAVDGEVHVHGFVDLHDLGDALLGQGFGDSVTDMEMLRATYGSVDAVMADLRGIGAHNIDRARRSGLTGKEMFTRFRAAYEAMAVDGRIPASYEIIFGYAKAPVAARRGAAEGAVAVPLSEIGWRRR